MFNDSGLKNAFMLALKKWDPNFLEKAPSGNSNILVSKFPTMPGSVKSIYDATDGGKMKDVIFYSVTDVDKDYPNLNYYFKTYGTVENMKKFLHAAQCNVAEPLMFFANIGPYKRVAFNAASPMTKVFEVDYNNPGVITTYASLESWVNYNFN